MGEHRLTEAILKASVAKERSVCENDVKIVDYTVKGTYTTFCMHISSTGIDFFVADGSGANDNYMCTMLAVEVKANIQGKKTVSNFMAKCLPMEITAEKKQELEKVSCVVIREHYIHMKLE